MRGLALAWMAGLSILIWRDVQQYHKPPVPGALLGASFVFVALALLAEYEPARRTAILTAWGFDVAVLLSIPPQQLTTTKGLGATEGAFSTRGQVPPTKPGG
jgi:hypothetical protein